jgi:hypothetical protein
MPGVVTVQKDPKASAAGEPLIPEAAPSLTPPPLAAKATDLEAIRSAVVDAAGTSTALWLSYLFVLFYLLIAAAGVTHRDLLLESPVKLPFLGVDLPLNGFFWLGPTLFLVVHAYVLLHFVMLAGKVGAFDAQLRAQIEDPDVRTNLRRQLPSNVFVQSLAGPREWRNSIVGLLPWLIALISLVIAPVALLVFFQLQFLPYHSEWISNWQRIAVIIDLGLLWILWPSIARADTKRLGRSDFKPGKVIAWAAVSALPALLVVAIATFPGEWLDKALWTVRLVPTTWKAWTLPSVQAIQADRSGWASLHELLVAGDVDFCSAKAEKPVVESPGAAGF